MTTSGRRPALPAHAWRNPAHWLAFGLGLGALPYAPGTFGTLLGVALYFAMQSLPLWQYLALTALLFVTGIALCASAARDRSVLCIVETPADRLAIEQATGYRGLYFVLQGRLSPLDGIGPRQLGLDLLASRLGDGEVRELIIATNPTVEGEATAHYLAQMARAAAVTPSRLAQGLPLGGELEYVDRSTLAHAFGQRATAVG